ATDQTVARAYAKILHSITGEQPVVVLSDDASASERIEKFSSSTRRWMVAVRMVSEGVDVPRLAVGVYATSSSTPLFFAQAIGRFVRARRRGEAASVFLPNVPVLMALAGEMERQRDHALDRKSKDEDGLDDSLLESANREEEVSDALTQEFSYQAISSLAHFDRVVFEGKEFGQLAEPGTPEEEEFIGLPGLLEPEHVHELLMQRQARQSRLRKAREASMPPEATTTLPAPLRCTPSSAGCAGVRRWPKPRWRSCSHASTSCANACAPDRGEPTSVHRMRGASGIRKAINPRSGAVLGCAAR